MVRARMRAPGVGAGTAGISGLGETAEAAANDDAAAVVIGDGKVGPADLAAAPAEEDTDACKAAVAGAGGRGGRGCVGASGCADDAATNATGGGSCGGDRGAADGGGSDTLGGEKTSAGTVGKGGGARAAALRRAFLRFTSAAAIVGSTGKMVVDSAV